MKDTLIINGSLVNEGNIYQADILIQEGRIAQIDRSSDLRTLEDVQIIDATDQYIIPGAIDDQVHFREPGLTHKADIYSESRSAVAGGVTSFMEMPLLSRNRLSKKSALVSRVTPILFPRISAGTDIPRSRRATRAVFLVEL